MYKSYNLHVKVRPFLASSGWWKGHAPPGGGSPAWRTTRGLSGCLNGLTPPTPSPSSLRMTLAPAPSESSTSYATSGRGISQVGLPNQLSESCCPLTPPSHLTRRAACIRPDRHLILQPCGMRGVRSGGGRGEGQTCWRASRALLVAANRTCVSEKGRGE